MDHFVRGQVYDTIRRCPGITYTEIKNTLGLQNGTLTHHLRTLELQGFIKSENSGKLKKFRVVGVTIPKNGGIRYSKLQQKIINIIENKPGITQAEISRNLNIHKSVINYNIKILKENGTITIENVGIVSKCYRKHL